MKIEIPEQEKSKGHILAAVKDFSERQQAAILTDSSIPESRKRAFLVDQVLKHLHIVTIRDTEEILYYDRGIYRSGGEQRIKELLQIIGDSEITNARRSEVLAAVRAKTGADRSEFDKDPAILNVKNGLLDVRTGQFRPHHPEHLSISQMPVNYDPRALCSNFVRFLRETLEPEHIGTIVKILGYLLYKKSVYHKAFMLYGEGSNGKSTLINTIEAFVGKENRATVSLQDLSTNRFAKAELYGKLVNLFADIPSKEIEDTGDFKMLVSGDPIGAERKHQQRFTFENYAKLIFSANIIPKSADKTYAYFRRWILIPFNRVFEGDDADEHLLEKLTTEEELSGILNLAIKGLKKLQIERGFKEQDIEEIISAYDLGASRIRIFLQEHCVVEPGNDGLFEESARLREAYRRFCKAHGIKHFNEAHFGRELKALGIDHRLKRIGGKRVFCDFGIALKEGRLDMARQNVIGNTGTIRPTIENYNIQEEIGSTFPKTNCRGGQEASSS